MNFTLIPGNIAFDWKLGQASAQYFILSVSPVHAAANTICDKKLVFETKPIEDLRPSIHCVAKYIYKCGLWFYYEDETSALSEPFDTIKAATEALEAYVAYLNSPVCTKYLSPTDLAVPQIETELVAEEVPQGLTEEEELALQGSSLKIIVVSKL